MSVLKREYVERWYDFFDWLNTKPSDVQKTHYALCRGKDKYCFTGLMCLYYSEKTGEGRFEYETNISLNTSYCNPFVIHGAGGEELYEDKLPIVVSAYFGLYPKVFRFQLEVNDGERPRKSIYELNDLSTLTFVEMAEVIRRDFIEVYKEK